MPGRRLGQPFSADQRLSAMSIRIVGSLAIALLVVVACGPASGPSPSPSPSGPVAPVDPLDATGVWRLESGTTDGVAVPLLPAYPVTLIVQGSRVGGTSACNGYGAELVVENGRTVVGGMGSTAMACEPEVMASEMAYTAALARVDAATMDGDALVLSGPGVSLRFVPVAPPATADIVDRAWSLEAMTEPAAATAARGERATLEIRKDGTFAGSTGCRSFTGIWTEVGNEIVATQMAMDGRECPADLAAQDSHVTSVLGDGFTIDLSVDGQVLSLVSSGGLGLQYRTEGGG